MEITDRLSYSAAQVADIAVPEGASAMSVLVGTLLFVGGAVAIFLLYRELTFDGKVSSVRDAQDMIDNP